MTSALASSKADQDQGDTSRHSASRCLAWPCITQLDAEPSGRHNWLLVTDVDDTLLGDRSAFSQFVSAVAPTRELAVVLNSSRPIRSLRRTLRRLQTGWRPCGMIGALGTEIELGGRRNRRWTQRFSDFDREPIDSAMARLGCEPHDPGYQTPLKASFSVPAPLQTEALKAIGDTGAPAQVIQSGDTSFDVIPEDAGKGVALQEVQARFDVAPDHTLAAGDSCNDLDMLEEANAIVVGNATTQLKAALQEGDVDAYHATRSHAAGVLEGLQSAGVPLRVSPVAKPAPTGG
jgi:hydroxymethylpyrimidine pyrophosphatase-like HAD family hydrolase